MEKINKAVYSVAEAAKVLGISRTLAYDLANAGELPVLRLGKRMVIPKAALERMLENVSIEEDTQLAVL